MVAQDALRSRRNTVVSHPYLRCPVGRIPGSPFVGRRSAAKAECKFLTPTAEILAVLLNDGTSPQTGAKLLKKETVDEMFRNQIPEFPHFGAQGIPASKPDLTNAIPLLYPSTTPQGWGLTFMLTGGATGRSPGTAHWAGLPNLWWWCDREKGIAGMVCTQILPFADAQVLKLWVDVEAAVYGGRERV